MAVSTRDMEELFINATIGAKVVELVRDSGVLSRKGRKPGSTNAPKADATEPKKKSEPAKPQADDNDDD